LDLNADRYHPAEIVTGVIEIVFTPVDADEISPVSKINESARPELLIV
jgi:hypothetical protein